MTTETRRYRSIWISDVHLGTRGCKTEFLLDFLRHNDSDYLYLVGDIIDLWHLKGTFRSWTQAHNDVIQKILRKARKGTRVVYVPGNHDEAVRDYTGLHLGEVSIENEATHVTADGKRLLILHGDKFDGVIQNAKWLAHLGSWAYDVALWFNHWFNAGRRRLGMPYWSLSAYLKYKVKNALHFVARFKKIVAHEAMRRRYDGVVCGHIHSAEIDYVDGIQYLNDGDWVESCTALVEHANGQLELVSWTGVKDAERAAA
jgi:UDP-2,3-diacylglucosamine pyrophosphatase LpxH